MGENSSKEDSRHVLERHKNYLKKKKTAAFESTKQRGFTPMKFKQLMTKILEKFKLSGKLTKYYDVLLDFLENADYATNLTVFNNISFIGLSKPLDSGLSPISSELEGITDSMGTEASVLPQSKNSKNSTSEKILQLLESEFLNKNSYFSLMSHCFSEHFAKKYKMNLSEIVELVLKERKGILTDKEKEYFEDLAQKVQEKLSEAITDIKDYESYVREAIKSILKGMVASRSDRKISLIIQRSLFGQRLKCYNVVMDLLSAVHFKTELKLKENMHHMKHLKPEDFDVPKEFALPNEKIPYLDVIDCLNFMDIYTTPQDKLNTIFKMKTFLIKSYEEYCKKEEIRDRVLQIGGDIILPIIAYCVSKCGNERLVSHLKFISYFKRYIDLSDEKDYYFTSLDAAIDYVLNCKEEDFKQKNPQPPQKPHSTPNFKMQPL